MQLSLGEFKGTPKNLCVTKILPNFQVNGVCLKALVLLGSALELFRKICFGTDLAIFWLWGPFFEP